MSVDISQILREQARLTSEQNEILKVVRDELNNQGIFKGAPFTLVNQAQGRPVPGQNTNFIDMSQYNAARILANFPTLTPSGYTADILVQGADSPRGPYKTLPDANATQLAKGPGLTTFDVVCGSKYLAITTANETPNLTTNITFVVTAYISGGSSSITNTASQNLTQINGTAVSQTNALPVSPTNGTPTDRSGKITTANTAQTLAAANTARIALEIQNQDTSDMWISFTASATTAAGNGSIDLKPGQEWFNEASFCPSSTVSIVSSVTNAAYFAMEK